MIIVMNGLNEKFGGLFTHNFEFKTGFFGNG